MNDATLPDPPIAPNVDLRDFQFMPLDVLRLRDSELSLTATAEGFRAAVLLWCAAWHQVPAGSLPDNATALVRLAGCDADAMHEALRGFVKCSDGRLYHPVVCEKANEAWSEKEKYRAAARKRWKNKKKTNNASHRKRIENASCETDKTHMQGTGTGTGIYNPQTPYPENGPDPNFDRFWHAYPLKGNRAKTKLAWNRATDNGANPETIIAAAERYAAERDGEPPKYTKRPENWLDDERWADAEPAEPEWTDDERAEYEQALEQAKEDGRLLEFLNERGITDPEPIPPNADKTVDELTEPPPWIEPRRPA